MRYPITCLTGACVLGMAATVSAFDWQSTWNNTWGYTMMSSKERNDFENAIRNLKTVKECAELLKHHNTVIQQRIDDWVITPKRSEPVDTCAELQAQGLLTE